MASGDTATERRKWPDGYAPEKTRRALVDSALHFFETRGFDRTSMQLIVDHAGLTKGAFYHHFGSKEDLLWRIQAEYLDAQHAAAKTIVEECQDAKTRIQSLVRLSTTGVAEAYRGHVAIFYQERRHLTGDRLEDVTRRRDRVEALFRAVIEQGITEGAFKSSYNPQIVSFGIIGMCAWAFQWLDPQGRLSIEEVSDQLSDLILDGLTV